MNDKNYWCFRIDTKNIEYLKKELHNGRLRQGWGWDPKQDLRNLKMDEGAKRNRPMLKVKKGDLILVPRLPQWDEVALVEATEDWEIGYQFEIPNENGVYGHIFPVKFHKSFVRKNKNVKGGLRSTMKNPSRFWNISHYADEVEHLMNIEQNNLKLEQHLQDRLISSIESVFQGLFSDEKFESEIYQKLDKQFTNSEWENLLVYGLREMFPHFTIDRTSGPNEKKHGTDILIKIPGIIPGKQYGIAIQVKDYHGIVGRDVIDQINKADVWNDDNLKIIEKIVLITRAKKGANEDLLIEDTDVEFIFMEQLKELLKKISYVYLSRSLSADL